MNAHAPRRSAVMPGVLRGALPGVPRGVHRRPGSSPASSHGTALSGARNLPRSPRHTKADH